MTVMTLYLDHKMILVRHTFLKVLVKIKHDDVTWRHVTYFDPKVVKSVIKVLISAKNEERWVDQTLFFQKSYIVYLRWGVNHFFTINGSKVMVSEVELKIADVTQKMLTSAKILTSEGNFLLETNVLMFLHNPPPLLCKGFI